MSINIKDAETDRLARELAAETGESITEALRISIAERLAQVRLRKGEANSDVELMEIIRRGRMRQMLTSLSADEILGYDGQGAF